MRIQILNTTICILHYFDTIGKGLNPTLLGQKVYETEILGFKSVVDLERNGLRQVIHIQNMLH